MSSQQRAVKPVPIQNATGHWVLLMMKAVNNGPRNGDTIMAPDHMLIFRLRGCQHDGSYKLSSQGNKRVLVEEENILDVHQSALIFACLSDEEQIARFTGQLTACATIEKSPLRIRAARNDSKLVAAAHHAEVPNAMDVKNVSIGKRPK